MTPNAELPLIEAYTLYVTELKVSQRQGISIDLNRFVQWYGRTGLVSSLTPQTVASYAEWVGLRGGDAVSKLEPVKAFLSFLRKKELVTRNLAPHLRVPKGKGKSRKGAGAGKLEHAQLTREGYDQLTAKLASLKGERVSIIQDIGRAMADKDFRENAPLDAAKERQGLVESMIKELEQTLGSAVIADKNALDKAIHVTIGKRVTLKDIASGRTISYQLVHPRESNPTERKLSSESPVGKALLNRFEGEQVEIAAPRGTFSYTIERVEG